MSDSSLARRVHYTANLKLSIVIYAESHGNRKASREYSVPESNIRLWRRQKALLSCSPGGRKTFRGREPHHEQVEEELAKFVKDRRSQSMRVSRKIICEKALELAQVRGIQTFKASDGWCNNFLRRYGFSLKRRTSTQSIEHSSKKCCASDTMSDASSARRMHYTAESKLSIVVYAESHGNRKASREYSVPESNIRLWRRQKRLLSCCSGGRRTFRGQKPAYQEVEEELAEFLKDRGAHSLQVSRKIVCEKALELAQVRGIQTFKASDGWYNNFLRRYGFCLGRRTFPRIIEHSIKTCCTSNALDGTEDDVLWDKESCDDTDEYDEDSDATIM